VDEVNLTLQGDGNYWDGDGFDSTTPVSFTATGTAAWSYGFALASFPEDGAYTLTSSASDDAGNVESTDTATFTIDTTPDDPNTIEEEAPPGGTVTNDPENEGATPEKPVTTAVTIPSGGTVSITTGDPDDPPSGYSFLGQQVAITAPPQTADPLVLVFRLDASLLEGIDANDIEVFKDGELVEDCEDDSGVADPDPCVASRETLEDDDMEITILTSTASVWNLGVSSGGKGSSGGGSTPATPPPPPPPTSGGNPLPATTLCAAPTIVGTAGNDLIIGTAGADVILALEGDNVIRSGRGSDVICAGSGDDVISGGPGRDVVWAGHGDNLVRGGSGDDRIRAARGADHVDGNRGADACNAGGGRNAVLNCELRLV
jgi:hypothetical protein